MLFSFWFEFVVYELVVYLTKIAAKIGVFLIQTQIFPFFLTFFPIYTENQAFLGLVFMQNALSNSEKQFSQSKELVANGHHEEVVVHIRDIIGVDVLSPLCIIDEVGAKHLANAKVVINV